MLLLVDNRLFENPVLAVKADFALTFEMRVTLGNLTLIAKPRH
jgi:hypothetical protein